MVDLFKDNAVFKKVQRKVEALREECYEIEPDKSHKDAARVRSL